MTGPPTGSKLGTDDSAVYQFSPHLVAERFDDEALVLVAEQDRFLTINRAALDLMELMRSAFGERGFSVQELAALLDGHYELSLEQSSQEAQAVVAAWFDQCILTLPVDGASVDAGR